MAKNITLVACVDERMGLMFNARRQSKDRVQRERLLALLSGERLFMSEYSGKLFGECEGVVAHRAFLRRVRSGETLFVEDVLPDSLKGVSRVILYKWNEHYPSDASFPFDLEKEGFRLASAADFEGSSHERITEEIYER